MVNAWTRQLMRDNTERPEGFLPALWVLIRGTKTFVPNYEENDYPVLNTSTLRKIDLECESAANGYWVLGIPEKVKKQPVRDDEPNEKARGERMYNTKVLRKFGGASGRSGYNMSEICEAEL